MSAVKLSSLPVGALLDVEVKPDWQSRFGSIITWRVADQGHQGYPAGCTTLIADKIIQLMCVDAKEPDNNSLDRRNYGNNRYIHSNIHQWLNSNAAAGKWYSVKHQYDAPPTQANVYGGYNAYDQWAGFLRMLDDRFVAALLTTSLDVVRSNSDGGSDERFSAKMYLASRPEVGLGFENATREGALLPIFSNDTSRFAYPTAQAVSNSAYKEAILSESHNYYWWLRTPNFATDKSMRCVYANGMLNENTADWSGYGLRPLCNLPGDTDVELSVTGNYVLAGLASTGKGRFQVALGGVLRPTSAPMPVIGGVRRMPTALRATIGGVLRDVWPPRS